MTGRLLLCWIRRSCFNKWQVGNLFFINSSLSLSAFGSWKVQFQRGVCGYDGERDKKEKEKLNYG